MRPARLSFSSDHPVPARYRGVWQRTLLAAPNFRDTTTTVLWLQTDRWHADLRIPVGRPEFSDVYTPKSCSSALREWLSSQQGFAGVTEVAFVGDAEICTWHRILDFQPPATVPDAAYMRFDSGKLIETGVHQDYFEHWEKLPESDNGFAVLERLDETHATASPREWLLVAGQYVMHVRDRRSSWPGGIVPGTTLGSILSDENRFLLDMEISFGRRTTRGWTVLHSLFPWLENKDVMVEIVCQDQEKLELIFDAIPSMWRKIEWGLPARIHC